MLLVLLSLLFHPQDDQANLAKERQRFAGAWELVEVRKNGEVEKEPLGGKTTYHLSADGSYLGKVGDSVVGKGTFKPVLNTKPSAVDWTAAGRQEFDGKFSRDYPSVGIYRIEGDTLTLALKFDGKAKERPVNFECKAGSDELLLKLVRLK